MKLKKINEDHYIVVDDKFDPIGSDGKYVHKSGRIWQWDSMMAYVSNNPPQLITHSTQPLGFLNEHGFTTANLKPDWTNVEYLPLSEAKELLGVVDVEKKAHNWSTRQTTRSTDYWRSMVSTYVEAYNQALEDNKEKKWTDEDVIKIVEKSRQTGLTAEYLMLSIQPQTEWEVEFVDGKLKLKS